MAISPIGWSAFWMPMGATAIGVRTGVPRIVVAVFTAETSRRTLGSSRNRANAPGLSEGAPSPASTQPTTGLPRSIFATSR